MSYTQTKPSSNGFLLLITRLHFYIGLFIGPFIFTAALTGTLYVLTPQIEQAIYKEALTTSNTGTEKPLAEQISAARQHLTKDLPLFAVRPAPEPGTTTRVMFLDATTASGARALFIDPVTLDLKGNMAVYGTSGVLPFRMTLDFMHRQLLLGETGRIYSELAASWLWIAALCGIYLWLKGRKKNRPDIAAKSPYLTTRRRHGQLGWLLLLGLIFFSATGLTWSKWAGSNIGTLRHQLGWITPSVNLTLNKTTDNTNSDEHTGHREHTNQVIKNTYSDSLFDQVLYTARQSGINADKIEIKPPRKENTAWFVREIDRSWPTQVDSVAIDPDSMKVVSRADFANFPIIAKLIRWGIDAHMGVLFGLPNQLLLAVFGGALCVMIIWGYTMWWRRRPQAGPTSKPLLEAWSKLTLRQKVLTLGIAIVLGLSLPVMGISLLLFLLVDMIRWKYQKA